MNDFDRFVRYLVETLQARSPDSVHRPVAIDDLRRTVLPYRVHRNALGLVSAEDYETLLLRLAAEEGEYSRTFPPEAAERCRAEIATPLPDLALLDELAEVTIAIEPASVSRILLFEDEPTPFTPDSGRDLPLLYGPGAELMGDGEGEPGEDAKPKAADPAPQPEPRRTFRPPTPRSAPAEPAAPEPAQASAKPAIIDASPPPAAPAPPVQPAVTEQAPVVRLRCRFCSASLPTSRVAAFCPFCGQQLTATRCPRCETELEPGWRHCINCGHPMGPPRTSA